MLLCDMKRTTYTTKAVAVLALERRDHLGRLATFARPGGFLCFGGLFGFGRLLGGSGLLGRLGLAGCALGRLCANLCLPVGLRLRRLRLGLGRLAEPLDALPDARWRRWRS